jgi:putative protease
MYDAMSVWNAGFIRPMCKRRVRCRMNPAFRQWRRGALPEDALSRRSFMVNVKPEMTGTATTESIRHPQSAIRKLPELLAPAGDWDCARAAVENGADAIYFGLEKFNARMRANNFTGADLPKLMEFLHRRGVRGYVTLNTLVFENELADAETYLRTMIAAGVDAVIVQDAGLCRLIRQLSSDFPIHASTQMTITSAAGVEFARELGCCLVVLARECSIKEIEKIRSRACESADSSVGPDRAFTSAATMPLEVFIHGALCVAYSGQCLTSEALGGRSANRGECAQACRMPYDLVSDGKLVPLGDRKYLLSPQDLAGLEVLSELIRAGVASLKIEGRLKSPEYVANITRIYRNALDALVESRESRVEGKTTSGSRPSTLDPRRYDMEMAFSRGLHTGWFGGTNNQQLVHARFGKKRGVYLGEIARVLRDGVLIRLEGPLKPGDGVVFDAGKPEENEEGGRVYEIVGQASRLSLNSKKLETGKMPVLRFGHGDINFSRIHVGDKLWKTSDPELDRRLRQSYEGEAPKFQRPAEIEVHGIAGRPLTLIAHDEFGNVAKVESSMPLAKAEKQPLTTERLREQLGRLGGTPFKLGELKNSLSGEVLLPVSELNRLRREIAVELERLRTQPKRWTLNVGQASSLSQKSEKPPSSELLRDRLEACPTLIALVRNLPQFEAALSCGVTTIYCEFEDPKKYREAVGAVRAHRPSTLNPQPSTIFVAPPRIFKPGEEWTLEQVRSCNADGYLVRNYDHLKFFARDRRIGDYSLNVANRLAADYFKNQFGLERVTASYDLNFQQLEALLSAAPPEWFEVTIHQHMPMFHMEHCVFCAFLSTGTDFRNCGRPCDVHDVRLRDRVGAEHPLKADVGCRNTVFNALAQTGAEYVLRMMELGVRHFRVEFLNETPEQVTETVSKYRRLLQGEITGTQLWRELKLMNQLGVTRGQIGK